MPERWGKEKEKRGKERDGTQRAVFTLGTVCSILGTKKQVNGSTRTLCHITSVQQ